MIIQYNDNNSDHYVDQYDHNDDPHCDFHKDFQYAPQN